MIKPNFLFLLAISVCIWGHHFQTLPKANAQTPPRLGQPETIATYDQLMKSGYEATIQRNYQLALEKFQQALAQRPNDTYAQNAIANIQKYLGQTATAANAAAKNEASPIPLIAGSALLSIALLAGFTIAFLSIPYQGQSLKTGQKDNLYQS
jgi:hypothetical protein